MLTIFIVLYITSIALVYLVIGQFLPSNYLQSVLLFPRKPTISGSHKSDHLFYGFLCLLVCF